MNMNEVMSKLSHKTICYILLALILVVGMVTRIYQYPNNPTGLNQDEASIAYDVYAVANYGVDRNGDSWPVHFVGWGNGQSAFYGYLIMPFVKVFGFSPATTRIGNLLAGIIAILLLFFLLKAIGLLEFGLVAAFLLAISPWGIMTARWGPEASILPFVLLLGVYLYTLTPKNPIYLPLSFAVFSMSYYSYATAYFFTTFFILFLIFHARRFFEEKKQYFKYTGIALGVFIVLSIPIGLFILINIIFKDMSALKFLGISIPKLVQTGVRYSMFVPLDGFHGWQPFMDLISRNFQYYVDTVFGQKGSMLNVIEPYGYYFYFSNFFLFSGLALGLNDAFMAIRQKKFSLDLVFLVWFILASLLGILMETNPFRVNAIFFSLFYFVAKGIYCLVEFIYLGLQMFIKSESVTKIAKNTAYLVIAVIYLTSLLSFFRFYTTSYNGMSGLWFRESFQEAFKHAESIRGEEQNLYVADYDTGTIYVYVLYYGKIDPVFFNKNVVYYDPYSEWRPVKEFGPYKFIENTELLREPDPNGIYIVFHDRMGYLPRRAESKVTSFKNYCVYQY